jgi:DNA repair photolyase
MALNRAKGDMYSWVGFTWNPIKGQCSHNCKYCFAARTHGTPIRLDKKCFKDNLGSDNKIFVGSSTDMWAENVKGEWINRTLEYCKKFDNEYLFQTKNPMRFLSFVGYYPVKTTLCSTIETNRNLIGIYNKEVPPQERRYAAMKALPDAGIPVAITIEPIMDFTVKTMVAWILDIRPAWVAIGADSGNHHLPEPPPEKIRELIVNIQNHTEVRLKPNLKRIMKGKTNEN